MRVLRAKVPWRAFGPMLPTLLKGNRFLIAIGMLLVNTPLFERYFSMLQVRGLVRLKTSAEIEKQEVCSD